MNRENSIIRTLALCFAFILAISIIAGIISAVVSVLSLFDITGDGNNYKEVYTLVNVENMDNIKNLDLDLSASTVKLEESSSFKIETNNKNIFYEINDFTISIKDKKKHSIRKRNKSVITIYVPKSYIFNNVSFSLGAGLTDIDSLSMKKGIFNLGAGKFTCNNLNVQDELIINGGAGKIDIDSGNINNMKLDMGVGSVNITTSLIGSSDIDGGVGSINLALKDSLKNYKIYASKGIGSIKLNDEEIKNEVVVGNGENSIKIDGGVGSINIDVKE